MQATLNMGAARNSQQKAELLHDLNVMIKKEKFMKKRISLLVLTLTLCLSGIQVQAAEKSDTQAVSKYFNLFLDEVKSVKSDESISALKDSINQLVEDVNPEDAKKIINFIGEKIEEGKWESEKGVEEAIAEGEKEFGATLTEEQKNMILSVVSKIKKLGIKPEYIVEQAEEIYEKYGEDLKNEISEKGKEIAEETQNKIKEEVNRSLTDYFSDMVSNVKSFFAGIFSK